MEHTFTIRETSQSFTDWTNRYGEARQAIFTYQEAEAVLYNRAKVLWHPVRRENANTLLGWVKFRIRATEPDVTEVTATAIGAEYHTVVKRVVTDDGYVGEEHTTIPFVSKEIGPELEQYYQAMMQAIRQKWRAEAAEPELPPRPGADGATWDDTFDWYHRNRDKCRSLEKLAALIAYDPGTVRNRHSEYQAERK